MSYYVLEPKVLYQLKYRTIQLWNGSRIGNNPRTSAKIYEKRQIRYRTSSSIIIYLKYEHGIYNAKANRNCKNFSIKMLGVRKKVLLRISFLSSQSNNFSFSFSVNAWMRSIMSLQNYLKKTQRYDKGPEKNVSRTRTLLMEYS